MKVSTRGVVSRALRDVWAWKDTVNRETDQMTTSEALQHIHQEAEAVRQQLGLPVRDPRAFLAVPDAPLPEARATQVADTAADYHVPTTKGG